MNPFLLRSASGEGASDISKSSLSPRVSGIAVSTTDERFFCAWPMGMEVLGHDLLAGAVSPVDQDRDVVHGVTVGGLSTS